MNRLKNLLLVATLLFMGLTVYFFYSWWQEKTKTHVEQNATVLLEKIQKVVKLTTVEGHFSELFEKSSFRYFDLAPFKKKVLVRVKAKVAAGFDFEKLVIEPDSVRRILWINSLPEPQILYIDHELDYYDITEGLFTSFSESDYNQIQKETKDLIRKKATESNILKDALTQGQDLTDMIRLIANASGWEIKIRSRPTVKN